MVLDILHVRSNALRIAEFCLSFHFPPKWVFVKRQLYLSYTRKPRKLSFRFLTMQTLHSRKRKTLFNQYRILISAVSRENKLATYVILLGGNMLQQIKIASNQKNRS